MTEKFTDVPIGEVGVDPKRLRSFGGGTHYVFGGMIHALVEAHDASSLALGEFSKASAVNMNIGYDWGAETYTLDGLEGVRR